MALAIFYMNKGEKSALIGVKTNVFVFQAEPAYIPRTALPVGIKEGDSFEIPDGFRLIPFVDSTTGEIRTTKDGLHELKTLEW